MSGQVEIEYDGKVYEAEYHIHNGVVTVYGDSGSEFTTIGGATPEHLAKVMPRRLAVRGEISPNP